MLRRSTALFVLSALALTACQSTPEATSPVAGTASHTSGGGAHAPQAAAPSSTSESETAAVQADSTETGSAGTEADGGVATSTGSSDAASTAASGDLLQVAGITDGDTIKVWIDGKREPVRLLGVDTPESKKPNTAVACYAQQATSKMQSLVQSKQVRLVVDPTQVDRDRYDRLVRYVLLPDGSDVSQLMIAGGFGREYTYAAPYAKQATFGIAQSQAQAAKRGLWGACTYASAFNPPSATSSQPFVQPSTTKSTPSARPTTTQSGACDIKGNISSSGEKIYHLPGQRHYEQTKISPSKGERWFCSESEAKDAGWRRSKV